MTSLRCSSKLTFNVFLITYKQQKSVTLICSTVFYPSPLHRLCDNNLLDEGVRTLLDSLPQNESLQHLSLMHTGLGDVAALELAERLGKHTGLLELNVAYNNIGDSTAVALADACREHPTIHTVQ